MERQINTLGMKPRLQAAWQTDNVSEAQTLCRRLEVMESEFKEIMNEKKVARMQVDVKVEKLAREVAEALAAPQTASAMVNLEVERAKLQWQGWARAGVMQRGVAWRKKAVERPGLMKATMRRRGAETAMRLRQWRQVERGQWATTRT